MALNIPREKEQESGIHLKDCQSITEHITYLFKLYNRGLHGFKHSHLKETHLLLWTRVYLQHIRTPTKRDPAIIWDLDPYRTMKYQSNMTGCYKKLMSTEHLPCCLSHNCHWQAYIKYNKHKISVIGKWKATLTLQTKNPQKGRKSDLNRICERWDSHCAYLIAMLL